MRASAAGPQLGDNAWIETGAAFARFVFSSLVTPFSR